MMPPIVYLNGEFLSEGNAFIPITDRGFLFGDGVFTTIKINEGHLEFLGLHLQKLEQDCEALGIVPQKFSTEIIHELIAKNHAQNGVWRLKIIVSAGPSLGLNLEKRSCGQLLMTLKSYSMQLTPQRLTCYPYPVSHPSGRLKSLAYLDRLWIADYALKYSFDDALIRDHREIILETSFANFFWRIGKDMFFPDSSLPLYQGITLQVLLVAGENIGLKVHPVQAKLEDISDEAQLYLCNSLKAIVPIIAIDAKIFKRDPTFENALKEAYIQSMCAVD